MSVGVHIGHKHLRVRTHSGDMKDVCSCMLARLHDNEVSEGTVPDDMPEYNVPYGAGCHPEWRTDE